jgi:hypothetical protein
MFVEPATTLNEIRSAMKQSMPERCEYAARLANESDEQWLLWCNLNDEGAELSRLVNGAVEVSGADSNEHKSASMLKFSDEKIRALVTKPKIAGFGMNWQNCRNMAFVGLSHSYEALYQAVRRCWRFGQKRQVNAHIVIGEREGNVLQSILRKEKDMEVMHSNMIRHMSGFTTAQIGAPKERKSAEYAPTVEMKLPKFMVQK